MSEPILTAEQRRARRAQWPSEKGTLGTMKEASALHATPLERLAMVWQLTLASYSLAGIPDRELPRSQWPSRFIRKGTP